MIAIEYRDRNYDVLEGADALVIHTEWHPYRRPTSSACSSCFASR